jgi:outer membrane receptor protein involved in Fe transport
MRVAAPFSLATASFAAIALASTASAQSPGVPAPASAAEERDAIIVTGSRIPRPEVEGIIPGVQVTAADIDSRGFTSVLDALNDLPLIGPGASPIGNAGGQPASLGASFVDLLDLGTQRTLTLVNGRRFVSGNAGSLFVAANATGGQVDLNAIPAAFIARTDVLTVGGAVAYGSDAIAGVVNIVLKDDLDDLQVGGRAGVTSRGDAFSSQLWIAGGHNFADDRANVSVAFEYAHDDALQGDQRESIRNAYIAPTFFGNGGRRNSAFAPAIPIDVAGLNNGAFLRASDDGVPNNQLLPLLSGGSILLSPGGTVFQYTGANPTFFRSGQLATNAANTGVLQFLAGNTQLIPGVPIAAAQAVGGPGLPAGQFTRFAPTGLPAGVTAASVIAALAPGFVIPPTATAAQQTTLAVNLLQANRPTPREYFANNPNTSINDFLGTFIPAYLDVANTSASAAFLPRTAVPLQFNNDGALVRYNPATLNATTPGTVGGAPGGDFFNPAFNSVVRVGQERYIANLNARFDVGPNFRIYTENLYSRTENRADANAASGNTIAASTVENSAVLVSINHPFLPTDARNQLIAAGVNPTTGLFILSRTNQDIPGRNPFEVDTDTIRTVWGTRGDFGLFGRDFGFDVSYTYGRSELEGRNSNIKDIEYALALDAARAPDGRIVCAAQLNPAAYLGTTPPGVNPRELVRTKGSDGVVVESFVNRVVTQAQIDACQPLNPFGFGRSSEAAREYVNAPTDFQNTGQQHFLLGTLSGSPFDLPGGAFRFAVSGERRVEKLDYRVAEISRIGGTRTAALANTEGEIRATEFAIETIIPVFGEDFTLPILGEIELTPGLRYARQSGSAPDVRLISGSIFEAESKGDWNRLWTLGGTWKPFQDVTVRGNITRSIRQPSIVELFLGGQPAFTGVVDPCSTANINLGVRPAVRRANCENEVIRLGLAPDRPAAATFLNLFVPSGANIQGTFSGSPDLAPERGRSWTAGAVLQPRWVPGLTVSGDYIDVQVLDQIIPTTIVTALQVCYDSPGYPDTSGEVGVNVCDFFRRVSASGGPIQPFNVDNGFNSGFINLGALRVKAVNATVEYRMPLDEWFGWTDTQFQLYTNVYRLLDYLNSPAGDFSDTQQTGGTFFRPDWELQVRGRFIRGPLQAQWNWNWQNATIIRSAGSPITTETQDVLGFPSFGVHDFSLSYDVAREWRVQFTMRNVFDKTEAGVAGLANGGGLAGGTGTVDVIGRRFQVSIRANF